MGILLGLAGFIALLFVTLVIVLVFQKRSIDQRRM